MRIWGWIATMGIMAAATLAPQYAHAVCSNNEDGNPGVAGEIEYFTATNELMYCDDTDWVLMTWPGSYAPNTVNFDGSTYLEETGLSGGTNPSLITGSFWFKRDPANLGASQSIVHYPNASGEYFRLRFTSTDLISIDGQENGVGVFRNLLQSSTSYTDNAWYHVVFSLDSSNRALDQLYVNDVDVTSSTGNTFSAFGGGALYRIGLVNSTDELYGDLADLWVDFGTKLDLSIEANRRLFIDASGNPVNLGSDGSNPTGSQPELFFSGDTNNWHTNKGSLGGATEIGTLTTATSTPNPLYNGLIGYWPLNETGGTTAADSIAGVNATTVNAPAWVSGKIENGLDIDGVNQHANASGVFTANYSEVSFSAWFKADTWGDEDSGCILCFNDTAQDHLQVRLLNDSGQEGIRSYIRGSSGGGAANASNTVTLNKWHHVVVTFDAAGDRMPHIFLDGSEVTYDSQSATSGTHSFNGLNLRIGADGAINRFFDGVIDDVRLYSRALTDAEIQILAACTGAGKFYYNFGNDKMQWCDGIASAKNMGDNTSSGNGQCNGGAGYNNIPQGTSLYNPNSNIMYYCNGDYLVPIGKTCTECGGSATNKVAFLTVEGLSGSTLGGGGASAADAYCQNEADTAGLSGTYKAWIADSNAASAPATSYSSDIRGGSFGIIMTDGTMIANDWADLIDGTIANDLNISAFGSQPLSNVGANVRTNLNTDGTQYSSTAHCSDFGTITGSVRRGDSRFNDSGWTSQDDTACGSGFHLYCFEQ